MDDTGASAALAAMSTQERRSKFCTYEVRACRDFLKGTGLLRHRREQRQGGGQGCFQGRQGGSHVAQTCMHMHARTNVHVHKRAQIPHVHTSLHARSHMHAHTTHSIHT